jgi:hypothetical protein
MDRRMTYVGLLMAITSLRGAAATGAAASGCDAFSWNVDHELAVMREPARKVLAQPDAGNPAAAITVGHHYEVTLRPQAEVNFAMPPARPARDPAPQGGSLGFVVETAGRYRISITSRHWIDVVAGGKVIDSIGHQGSAGCELLHKVVEFDLPAGMPLTLQLSGRAERELGLAITQSPASG